MFETVTFDILVGGLLNVFTPVYLLSVWEVSNLGLAGAACTLLLVYIGGIGLYVLGYQENTSNDLAKITQKAVEKQNTNDQKTSSKVMNWIQSLQLKFLM